MKKFVMVGQAYAIALAALSLTLFAGQANAVPINSPVPSNAYIVYNGLDWAWAAHARSRAVALRPEL
jgi:hypothetical protein